MSNDTHDCGDACVKEEELVVFSFLGMENLPNRHI